jgi:protein-tyrosine sulfotransferase
MSAAVDAPIFILSHARSGSTLVRYILDAHPRVASPPESFVGRAAHFLCQFLSSVGPGPSGWGQTIHSPDVVSRVRAIVNEPLQRYAHDRGKFVWCEKTPDNVLFLETIAAVFPDARYICLHRHGLDVAHSWAELAGPRSGLHHHFAGHAEERPYKSLLSWTDITSHLIAFEQAHRDACHRVLYEQLVTTPERTVSALLSFLRLDAQPTDLIERAFLQPRTVGFGCPKAQTSTRITAEAIGKGMGLSTEALSEEQFQRFNDVLTQLGYAPVTRDSNAQLQQIIQRQTSEGVLTELAELTESLTVAASDLYFQAGGDRSLVSLVVQDPATSRELLRLEGDAGRRGSTAEATIVVSPGLLEGLVSNRENAGEAFLRGHLRVIGNTIRGLEFCQLLARAAAHGPRSSFSVVA